MEITNTTIENKTITAVNVKMVATNLEKFLVRSGQALNEVGITLDTSLGSKGEEFGFKPVLQKNDLPHIEDMLVRLEKRANRKLTETDHPFTFYDFKQALGIVADTKAGMVAAEAVSDFLEGRKITEPTKPKTKTKTKKKRAVSLKPVPEKAKTKDPFELRAELDAEAADMEEEKRANADAELKAELDAVDEALEKEKEGLKKARAARAKTKKSKTNK